MEIKTIYKYKREDGGTTVSPNKPEGEYSELFRVIAAEGKAVTQDGTTFYSVIDAESTEGWQEVDAPEYDEEAAATQDVMDSETQDGADSEAEELEDEETEIIIISE